MSCEWFDEQPTPLNVSKSSIFRKDYKSCSLARLQLTVGDFIFVSEYPTEDLGADDTVDDCDVGEIVHLYDSGNSDDPPRERATVRWFTRVRCLPKPPDFSAMSWPPPHPACEVVEDSRPFRNEVRLSHVVDKCQVDRLSAVVDPTDLVPVVAVGQRQFVVRFRYVHGSRPRFVPLKDVGRSAGALSPRKENVQTAGGDSTPRKTRVSTGKENAVAGGDTTPSSGQRTSRSASRVEGGGYRQLIDRGAAWKQYDGLMVSYTSPDQLRLCIKRSPSARSSPSSARATNDQDVSPFSASTSRRLARGRPSLNHRPSLSTLCEEDEEPLSTGEKKRVRSSAVSPTKMSSAKRRLRLADQSDDESDFERTPQTGSARKRRRRSGAVPDAFGSSSPSAEVRAGSGLRRSRGSASDYCDSPLKSSPAVSGREGRTPSKSATTPRPRRRPRRISVDADGADGTPSRSTTSSALKTTPRRASSTTPDKRRTDSTPKRAKSPRTPKSSAKKQLLRSMPGTPQTPRTPGSAARTPRTPGSAARTPRTPGSAARTPRTPGSMCRTPGSLSAASTPLQEARSRLHVAAVPHSLPCREDKFYDIYTFVANKLQGAGSGCMYVSGVPGTGKTATMREVVRSLDEAVDSGDLPAFQFIEVNGMRLTDPHRVYCHILAEQTGEKATPEHAALLLDRRFSNAGTRRLPILLLVDELDLLWTRKQEVLYNLFDWPTRAHAQLTVVAIANTMDLPERVMMNRVSSRLGLTRLTFLPYSYRQLQQIVETRLLGLNAFDPDAVQLVARKVAAVSGDARRALDICRRSTEIAEHSPAEPRNPTAEPRNQQLVNMSHVNQAIQEMFSAPKIVAIRCCSMLEKTLLRAVVMEFQRTGLEEARFGMVFDHLTTICRYEDVTPPSVSETFQLVSQLSCSRLLTAEPGSADLSCRIRLNVLTDDVTYAVREVTAST